MPPFPQLNPLEMRFRSHGSTAVRFMKVCLEPEPASRATATKALQNRLFDDFRDWFEPELQTALSKSPPPTRRRMKKVRTFGAGRGRNGKE